MKIKLLSSYRNGKGNIVFVYKVTGSKSQMAQYIESQGEYLKYQDDDESLSPLYFDTKYAGETGSLIITQKGRAVIDNTEESKIISLMEQHKGTALGDALALQVAAKMMKELGVKPAPAEKAPTPIAEPTAENDLDAL